MFRWASRIIIKFLRQMFPNFMDFNLETCKYVCFSCVVHAFTVIMAHLQLFIVLT